MEKIEQEWNKGIINYVCLHCRKSIKEPCVEIRFSKSVEIFGTCKNCREN